MHMTITSIDCYEVFKFVIVGVYIVILIAVCKLMYVN